MIKLKMFLCVTLALLAYSLQAQDIIVKKDGDIIKAKVLEIDELKISYKDFFNPTGPTYSILINNVLSLTYESGKVETFRNRDAYNEPSNNTNSDMTNAVLLSRIADLESKAGHISTIGTVVGVTSTLGLVAADVILFNDNLGLALGVGVPVILVVMFGEIALFNSIEKSYKTQADALRSQMTLNVSPSIMKDSFSGKTYGTMSFVLNF